MTSRSCGHHPKMHCSNYLLFCLFLMNGTKLLYFPGVWTMFRSLSFMTCSLKRHCWCIACMGREIVIVTMIMSNKCLCWEKKEGGKSETKFEDYWVVTACECFSDVFVMWCILWICLQFMQTAFAHMGLRWTPFRCEEYILWQYFTCLWFIQDCLRCTGVKIVFES